MYSTGVTDDVGLIESVRQALLRLYDPAALATASLGSELIERGVRLPARGLYELLIDAIERLKPVEPAPPRSHGWRCYRYLQLRYVECEAHAAIAQDLGISLRHAARVHQDALRALVDLLLARADGPAPSPHPMAHATPPSALPQRRVEAPGVDVSWEAELLVVGRQQPEGTVDVADVAASVGETFRRFASAHRGTLRIELPDELSPVRVNRVALRQILLNLLLYLVRVARTHGVGPEIAISLRGEQTGGAVTLTAEWEDGAGMVTAIPPLASEDEMLLTAAKRLAQLQGATIEVVGGHQPPCSLFLRLPVGVMRTVLLVDDNPDVGELFRRMLAKTRYRLAQIRTANRALGFARENPPDAIILDVVMPTRDGWEIQAALQSDRRTADVPVVICSVLPDRELALSLGAADFLAKPVTRATLLRTLDRLLR